MKTVEQLRAEFREQSAALQALIATGEDIPAEVLACKSRVVGWARRAWKTAQRRETKQLSALMAASAPRGA